MLLSLIIIWSLCCGIGNARRQLPPFGKPMLEEFLLAKNLSYLNHGSYGTFPKVVLNSLQSIQLEAEDNPDLWIRRNFPQGLEQARKLLGDLIQANYEDIVIIPNATSGLNAILQSLIYAMGERILYISSGFNGVKEIVRFLQNLNGGGISGLQFNITYPISNKNIVSKFESFLKQNHNPKRPIRMAVLEHVSTSPGVINPIEKLIPILKRYNISILIDGAHAVGHIPVNITALDVDYYITDVHKWLYVPRGFGAMFVRRELQKDIHPVQISMYYKEPPDFTKEFIFTGTVDYARFMMMPISFKFIQDAGGLDAIRKYCHNLALKGSKKLVKALGTEILGRKEQLGNMFDVLLPIKNNNDPKLSTEFFSEMQFEKYNSSFVKVNNYNGKWYARVSAQIYNDLNDFDILAGNLLKITEELNSI